MKIAAVRAHGVGRSSATGLLASRLLSALRHGGGGPSPLVIVPQDLRICDPSVWPEIEAQSFGLSGTIADLDGRSPFDLPPPSPAWLDELHGFGWLRHLEAANADTARNAARNYVLDWLSRARSHPDAAHRPAVRARRVISWISHAPFLLEGATQSQFDAVGRGVAREVMALSGSWRKAGEGYGRLLALTALIVAHLAIKGRERQLASAVRWLTIEIERQMLTDGGHVSRNPAVGIELLLDWLPLPSCFDARGLDPPPAMTSAITRMLAMLRFMKLGDGALPRFNGSGIADPSGLATLAAYDDRPLPGWVLAPQSGYARLASGRVIVMADVGAPPPLRQSGDAHAGCLSFEMSVGRELLFVNAGAPGHNSSEWRAVSRATASHSTACLGESSSSRLVRHPGLEALLGAVPLQGPANVTANIDITDAGLTLEASHDGYLQRLGLIHHRTWRLSADGFLLAGVDRIETRGQDRLRRDVPFAIHFHLHPDCVCGPVVSTGDTARAIAIHLRSGQCWTLQATGAAIGIEESLFFTASAGPRPSLQIVLRGATAGLTEVSWQVSREQPPPAGTNDHTRTLP